jgi:hypothetical protein
MSKIVRVQTGDYRIITAPGGTITLDSGSASIVEPAGWPGGVIINGDLLVNGITTTIKSETLTVKDRIIDINVYDVIEGTPLPEGVIDGSGLPSTSGIQIDRGNAPDVSFLWDERIGAFVLVDASYLNPTDNLRNSALALGARSILTGGSNLTLVGVNLGSQAGEEEGVVDVIGSVNYAGKILNYDLLNSFFEITRVSRMGGIVELQLATPHGLTFGTEIYVDCYPFPQINTTDDEYGVPVPTEITIVSDTVIRYTKSGTDIPEQTFFAGFAGIIRPVSIKNNDYIPNMKAVVDYTASALVSFNTNKIAQGDSRVIVVDDSIPDEFGNPQASEISFDINGVTQAVINSNGLFVDNIQIDNNTIKNKNSSLDKILFDSVLELKTKPGDPGVSSGYVSLYSKPVPGTGGTGLFFVNTEGTRDELISKTKALLYSLIL